ncbi:hypothetical protein AOQ84DRAFT_443180 [Glonium stellatum]|uniref:BZIP domain-containing protein n=1 Tax=Glonium stellatum TaxID=574774 RepID=A0A8E2EQG5_9PEZI|nr:hypothetical protein AOQ84DRAFT_443180 [Glonium stellatum]
MSESTRSQGLDFDVSDRVNAAGLDAQQATKPTRKRALTDRRRAQNRLHQKKFREKQKALSNAEASRVDRNLASYVPDNPWNFATRPDNQVTQNYEPFIPLPCEFDPSTPMMTSQFDISSSCQLGPAGLPGMYQSNRATPGAQTPQGNISALSSENYCSSSLTWGADMMAGPTFEDVPAQSISLSMDSTSQQDPIAPGCPLFQYSNNFALDDSEDPDRRGQPWHISLNSRPVTGMTQSQLSRTTSIVDTGGQASQAVESSEERLGHMSTLYLETSLQSLPVDKQRPTIVMPQTRRLHNNDQISKLPDPYRNHLRIDRINLYAACIANSDQLGVPKLLAKSIGFMSPFCQSPANRDFSFGNDNSFQHLKPNLRPVPAQLSQPHEYYIDLLPFPTFRARLLAIISLSPPVINEDELKADLDADGIVCWGSAGGGGRRGGYGVPWDMRSWEAKPWFLAKWWMLTDGEVADQSLWWRSMRGEEDELL